MHKCRAEDYEYGSVECRCPIGEDHDHDDLVVLNEGDHC